MNRIVVGTLAQTYRLALLDVPETRAGPGWLDADGDKLACLLRCVGSQGEGFLKGCPVCNQVIGRENKHDGCVIASGYPAGAERDRSSGIAFGWLAYDVLFWEIPEQFANCAFLFCVRED